MTVLEHGIQGYPVVFLREVFARDADLQATIEQLAINPVMVPAPRQAARIMLVMASFTGPVPRLNCSV
jgi:hypothetical protein